uniref:Uncharacterized protein n=1 Tax=Arundo donax TaxID=35708 RepID=A0A0A9BLD7_ARUDO
MLQILPSGVVWLCFLPSCSWQGPFCFLDSSQRKQKKFCPL